MPFIRFCLLAVYVALSVQTMPPLCMPTAAAEEEKRVLHLYTWEGYFDSNVIGEFQERFDCEVMMGSYDSNDILYEAVSLDNGSYDLVTPSASVVGKLYRSGLLRDLDHSQIPNIVNLNPQSSGQATDKGNVYSISYTVTVTGIGYRKDKVDAELLRSWNVFSNPELANRMLLLNDSREVLGAALKTLGYSLNTTNRDEITEAGRLAAEWVGNGGKLGTDAGRFGLIDGEYWIVQNYDGEIALGMVDNPNIGFLVPEEGAALNSDQFVITKNSPVPELAHAFINFMLEPEIAKMTMESIRFNIPNDAAMALFPRNHAFRLTHPAFTVTAEALEKCEVANDLGADDAIYESEWKRIITGGTSGKQIQLLQ